MADAYVDVILQDGSRSRAFRVSGGQSVTDFRGEDDAYVTLDDTTTGLLAVLYGVGGGQGVSMDHIFESAAARDAYFDSPDPHLDELIIGTPIVVQLGTVPSPDVRVQVWAGDNQPSVYPDPITTEWADAGQANLTTDQIQILSTLAALTDGQIPQKSGVGFAASSMVEEASRILSVKEIHAPSFVGNTGSLFLGSNKISSAGIGLELNDAVSNRQCGIIAKQVGQNRPQEYLDGAEKTVDVQTENTMSGPGDFTLNYTVPNEGGRDGARIAAFVVIPEAAGEATLVIKKTDVNGPDLLTESSHTFEAGDVGNETEIRLDDQNAFRVEDDTVTYVGYTGPALRGSLVMGSYFPFLRIKDTDYTTESLARMSDFSKERVGIAANTIITSANLDTYNRKVIYSTATGEITLTITAGINIDFFDIVVVANSSLLIATQGAERINGETDIRFTEFEGGRIIKIAGNYNLIFDNTDPDMTDNYVDTMSFDAPSRVLTLGRTGTLPDLTETIPAGTTAIFDEVIQHTASGVQNYGGEFGGKVHELAATVTNFDALIGSTFADDSVLSIVNLSTAEVEFDISAVVQTFAGDGAVDPHAYNLPASSTTIFYVGGTNVYPIASTETGGAATGDNPVLTRDTPSLAELAAIANDSLDNNSGLWVVANDQIQATEDLVDTSIMIRALNAGIPDANGDEIPTTARQKRGLILAIGTIVRVFSSTDLRVVSTPGESPTTERYPDVPFSGAIRIEEDQGLYNSYLGRTATNEGGSNQYISLPDLHPSNRPSWVVPGNVFVMRHTGTTTGNQRPHFRPDNTGDTIAGHGLMYWADPGETIAVQAPNRGIRTWQLFPISQRSDGSTMFDPTQQGFFYIDDVGALASDNPVRLHNRHELADGLVRDHIRESSSSINPITLEFQKKNYQDDIAWIQWWSAMGAAVPPLGTTVDEILENIPASLSWIETNINNGYDFEFNAPDATIVITAITNDGGNSFRIELDDPLPVWFAVNDEITITGAVNAGNNGTFVIDSIAGDRLLFNITNASGVNESGVGPFTQKTIYADAVLVSHDLRQTNFNLYEDSARTSPQTINTNWFDKDNTGADSVLAIGYNTDVTTTPPAIQMEDDNGDFFVSLAPPRGQVFDFDNTGGNYQNTRYLPLNYEDIHIRTDGTCQFYFDLHPDDLPVGQRRRYSIYSDVNNDDDDVTINVGRAGSTIDFDEGLSSLSILNGTNQAIEIYNDGTNSGVRIVQPFEKYIPSASLTNVVTPAEGPLAMSIAEIVVAESQDPNFSFYTINSNKVTLKGAFRYILTYRVKLRFDGNEDTGLSFVNVELVPTRERSSVTTDLSRETGNSQVKIDFVRNGNSSDDNTKPVYTLTGQLFYYAQPDDKIGWELRFGQFPAGYSVSDLRQIERQYTITVKGGID